METRNNQTAPVGEMTPGVTWEQQTLERLAFASLTEQRRQRRWGIFFKSLFFLYLVFVTVYALGFAASGEVRMGRHAAIVDLYGSIHSEEASNADQVNASLRSAFENENSVGVILRVNSPGGSPVQSGLMYNEIMRLRDKYPKKHLYAVIEDIGASGAYFVASAAEKIYVNPSSIVGSIGVLIHGFGFSEALKKLGVERRLLTAGKHKGFLDPFSPLNETQKEHAQMLLSGLHQQFIDAVRKGRGERLKADTPDLFSGLLWTGEQSIALGLADAVGNVGSVMRDELEVEQQHHYSPKENVFERFGKKLGVGIGASLGRGWLREFLQDRGGARID